MADENNTSDVPRRSFLSSVMAALLGLAALAAPVAASVSVLFDPIFKKKKQGGTDSGNWIRVTSLSQIPADGKPHQFAVIDPSPTDKWNRYDPQPERPVLLIRESEEATPVAISSTCPHVGCIVGFRPDIDKIVCPCHNAEFSTTGKQDGGSGASPRDLDTLEVRVDQATGDVLVNYQRFKEGIAEKQQA
ncbi:QcrA and Rieske domain-containing protein [Aeoliella mucimassa]|uniref:Cytochrome b6-f complex iron-sulfur subunit n=1 Tax=Aeoliella mucimassa TaxID=2527972 RepID=A0A518AIN5_9BACT|nr:Rieske (2Fe-2S) protein [Aeoliella mucimassa]QDU54576.1 Cytochrome b6-f complex iron-sulfur subunit [Aeoliella mucimassa]